MECFERSGVSQILSDTRDRRRWSPPAVSCMIPAVEAFACNQRIPIVANHNADIAIQRLVDLVAA